MCGPYRQMPRLPAPTHSISRQTPSVMTSPAISRWLMFVSTLTYFFCQIWNPALTRIRKGHTQAHTLLTKRKFNLKVNRHSTSPRNRFDFEKLHDPNCADISSASVGGKFNHGKSWREQYVVWMIASWYKNIYNSRSLLQLYKLLKRHLTRSGTRGWGKWCNPPEKQPNNWESSFGQQWPSAKVARYIHPLDYYTYSRRTSCKKSF